MRDPYIVRLVRNAYNLLKKYGFRAFVAKTRFYINARILGGKDAFMYDENKAYSRWIEEKEQVISADKAKEQIATFQFKPLISMLIPVYNVEERWLSAAIDSVIAQYYTNWELSIVNDASTDPQVQRVIDHYVAKDPRIFSLTNEVNLHISLTTNRAFENSKGEYIFLMDNDDEIRPHTLFEYVARLNQQPGLDLIYSDEDKLSMDGERIEPFFKPDPSPELLLSMMYPTHALYSRKIYQLAGMLRKGFEGSQDFDLALRVFDLTDKIAHIPKILYHWRKIPGSTAENAGYKEYLHEAARKAISESLARRGYKGSVEGMGYPFRSIIQIEGEPSVEVIIPTRNNVEYLKGAIESVGKSTYPRLQITVVDNQSDDPHTKQYLDSLPSQGIKVIDYNKPFNFSAINNLAASESSADYLLFLNNDVKVLSRDWVEEMLMWAQNKEVGAVGAKLLYDDGTVQHGGILLEIGGISNHAYYQEIDGSVRYFNHLNCVRNYSAVTGACLMVARAKFDQVGGFNEQLKVAFNDIDLGLKLMEAGYRNVYTPFARLIHYESKSRPKKPDRSEENYMMERWGSIIKNDPYGNINFDRGNPDGESKTFVLYQPEDLIT